MFSHVLRKRNSILHGQFHGWEYILRVWLDFHCACAESWLNKPVSGPCNYLAGFTLAASARCLLTSGCVALRLVGLSCPRFFIVCLRDVTALAGDVIESVRYWCGRSCARQRTCVDRGLREFDDRVTLQRPMWGVYKNCQSQCRIMKDKLKV